MAEERPDDAQKTEEPTQKRLNEAHEKGQVAKSQEVGHWFMLLAAALAIGLFGSAVVSGLGESLYGFVARPHAIAVNQGALPDLAAATLWDLAWALLPFLVLTVAAALAGALLQIGFIFSAETLQPKLEKISPITGFKRLFSMRALVEFAKGLVKLALVGAAIGLLLWPERELIPVTVSMEPEQLLDAVRVLAFRVLVVVLAVMTVVAALDFAFQKMQHIKQLRMTKQELKDEFKQSEGDPMVKGRLRQIRTERARRRMMAAVPEADVVVANPTHFAVALKYEPGTPGAPRVTAKGADNIALKIRELAEQHEVPVVENPPLARALYDTVALDQEIPEQHYRAVAEIIGYVLRLKGRLPGRPRPPGTRPAPDGTTDLRQKTR
ncbi:MAG: flagellar biosynthesis protein FlhB [Kiloniellales bacterium]|nr:flagellar biosynthesis protein FlhB [Kiloniellales bacterium]